MLTRILVASFLIPMFIGLFWIDYQIGQQAPILFVVTLALGIRAAWEMTKLLRIRSFEPRFPLVCSGCITVISATWCLPFLSTGTESIDSLNNLGMTMLAYSIVVLGLFLSATMRFREPGKSMETLSAELLIVSYVGVLLSMTAQLRWVIGADAGYLVLGSLIVAVKGGDVGAYFFGRFLGKAKMSPNLSPAKTWWGARGALVMSALFSILWLLIIPRCMNSISTPVPLSWAILYGMIIGAVGVVGDLCESLIKRDVGQKDAARLMPGFGGLLDLLDSILYSGPVAYALWSLLLLLGWKM